MTLIEVRDALKTRGEEPTELRVKELYVFGSVARNKATDKSDGDILVEFTSQVGMYDFFNLKYLLEETLSSRVDLATKASLHPGMKNQIMGEAVRVD